MILAIIPARGGSKRIKNKNIKNFFNRPIISYPIQEAIKSNIFDKVIVSTDSDKIEKISKKFGAQIYFKRPKKLSGDKVSDKLVIKHAIKWVTKYIGKVKYVCVIYPTAALIKKKDLRDSFKILKKKKWSFVFSAKKYTYPVQRSFSMERNRSLKMLTEKFYNKRSQELKTYYHDAGQFYWGETKAWLSNKMIFGKNSSVFILDYFESHDVDSPSDWKILEKLHYIKNLKKYVRKKK